MPDTKEFDVAVVGASVAGCTAARLFAQQGARVALIERRRDLSAYKVTCTHAVLPPAAPIIERLGLEPALLARGAPRTQAEVWTPHGGWIIPPDDLPDGWGVTRRTLDPLLRELAVGTPGVEYFPGWKPTRALFESTRPAGVEIADRHHRTLAVRASLLVGADGRDSAVARLVGVPGRVRQNNRFFYFAYWHGVKPATTAIRVWLLDPEGATQFPNEDDLTVLVAGFHRSRLAEVRADLEGSYRRQFANLPDGPDLSSAQQVSKLLGKLESPNVIRPAAAPGVAFVGDAGFAADPALGLGITFAFQAAEWLVDETGDALGGPELDAALMRYRRKFAWRLGLQHLQIADFADAHKFRAFERLFFRHAAADPEVARALTEVLTRDRTPLRWLDPRLAARLVIPRRPSAPRRAQPREPDPAQIREAA